jgi:molecular chaperone DnaK
LFAKVSEQVRSQFGRDCGRTVVAVPHCFDLVQQKAVRLAAERAGLRPSRIIGSTSAAALAYGRPREAETSTIAVMDVSSWNVDVSILEMGEGVYEVRGVAGDTGIGTSAWDQRLAEHLERELPDGMRLDWLQLDGTSLRQARRRVLEAARQARLEMEVRQRTSVSVPFLAMAPDGPVHLQAYASRDLLEGLAAPHREIVEGLLHDAMQQGRYSAGHIDGVLLVGEGSGAPWLPDMIRSVFGKRPLGGLNRLEAVPMGAAMKAAALEGMLPDLCLVEALGRTLGVEVNEGAVDPVIHAGTNFPTRETKTYTTATDMQTQVKVHVLQGPSRAVQDNRSLLKAHLTNIPPAPAGVPEIEVTFEIDSNSNLDVRAVDRATGRTVQVVTNESNLGA